VLVSCTGGTYNVHVGAGLLSHAGQLLPSLPYARTAVLLASAGDKVAADSLSLALGDAGLEPRVLEVPGSQRAKDLATIARLSSELADLAVHKDDLIIGVGGEVVCDIAGFIAGLYNRGMPLALVPTTLAAQADAAVGGKASLNLSQGRNLLGMVHQPVVVISDVGLAARQRFEYAAGLAELVKHALISGGDLVGLLRDRSGELRAADLPVLARVVAKSVRVKADIVSNDEREQGDRLSLNYGHTFGHAIEQVSGPDKADDGESVAVGMMAAAYLARRQGRIGDDLVDLHRSLLSSLGLPVAGRFSLAELREAWLRDKKYRGSTRFVLLNGLGKPVTGVPADEASLRAVLDDLAA
jgi:3-dehydroquinate synthase/shikimate kinase/3-dehydroquinate synthase